MSGTRGRIPVCTKASRHHPPAFNQDLQPLPAQPINRLGFFLGTGWWDERGWGRVMWWFEDPGRVGGGIAAALAPGVWWMCGGCSPLTAQHQLGEAGCNQGVPCCPSLPDTCHCRPPSFLRLFIWRDAHLDPSSLLFLLLLQLVSPLLGDVVQNTANYDYV